MENHVGNLQLQPIQCGDCIGVDQFRFGDEFLEMLPHRRIDEINVFLDGFQNVLCPQVGCGDDGQCSFQFGIELFFVGSCGRSDIEYRDVRKGDFQYRYQKGIPENQGEQTAEKIPTALSDISIAAGVNRSVIREVQSMIT